MYDTRKDSKSTVKCCAKPNKRSTRYVIKQNALSVMTTHNHAAKIMGWNLHLLLKYY
jgi:hypothetical protein